MFNLREKILLEEEVEKLKKEKKELVSIISEALREIQRNQDAMAEEDPYEDTEAMYERIDLLDSALGLVQSILSKALGLNADIFTTKPKSKIRVKKIGVD